MILLHNKDENKWFTEIYFLFFIFFIFYYFTLFIFFIKQSLFYLLLFFFIQIKTSHVFTFNGQHS